MFFAPVGDVNVRENGDVWYQGTVTSKGCADLIVTLTNLQHEHVLECRAKLKKSVTSALIQQSLLDRLSLLPGMPAVSQLVAPIPEKSARQSTYECNPGNPKPIDLYITSYGGDLMGCLGAIDAMVAMQEMEPEKVTVIETQDGQEVERTVKIYPRPIRTHCFAYAASAGAMFYLCGRHRSITINDQYLLHQLSGGASGRLEYIEREVQTMKDFTERMYEFMLKRTGVARYAYWVQLKGQEKHFVVFVKPCSCKDSTALFTLDGDLHDEFVEKDGGMTNGLRVFTSEELSSVLNTSDSNFFFDAKEQLKNIVTSLPKGSEQSKGNQKADQGIVLTPEEKTDLESKLADMTEILPVLYRFDTRSGNRQRVIVPHNETNKELLYRPTADAVNNSYIHLRHYDKALVNRWLAVVDKKCAATMGEHNNNLFDAFKKLMEADVYLSAQDCYALNIATETQNVRTSAIEGLLDPTFRNL